MISVEQIRLLEERVLGVVERLNELRAENKTLKEQLGTYQGRVEDLESRMRSYTDSQAEIEQGILNALHQLDELEDEVTDSFSAAPATPPPEATSPAAPTAQEPEPESSDEETVVESEVFFDDTDPDEREAGQNDPELEIF